MIHLWIKKLVFFPLEGKNIIVSICSQENLCRIFFCQRIGSLNKSQCHNASYSLGGKRRGGTPSFLECYIKSTSMKLSVGSKYFFKWTYPLWFMFSPASGINSLTNPFTGQKSYRPFTVSTES